MFHRYAEGVERVVVCGEEHMTVADRDAGQMTIGLDCVSASIQLLAGGGIEGVESGVAGGIPSFEGKHYTVGDDRRRRI